MAERGEHVWGMAVVYAIDEEAAARFAAGDRWTPQEEPVKIDGPGCLACRQTYTQGHGIPCPGRPWSEAGEARRLGLGMLPREKRREQQLSDSRAARRRNPAEREMTQQLVEQYPPPPMPGDRR